MIRCTGLLLVAAAGLLAAPAAAQDAMADMLDVFNGQGDSLTNIFLARIFGCRLFPGVAGCDSMPVPALVRIIGLLNTFFLAVGMALLSWNAAVGTLQTAHEGKVFGSNWSSLWVPVRTLTAIAMLAPLPAIDGYTTIQASIAWMVRGSTAAASIVWARSSTLILNHQAPVTAPELVFDQEVLRAGWNLSACQAVTEKTMDDYLSEGANDVSVTVSFRSRDAPVPAPDDLMTGNPVEPIREFGTVLSGASLGMQFESCGTITLPSPPEVVAASGNAPRWYDAHRQAMEAVVHRLRPAAGRLLEAATSEPGREEQSVNRAASALKAAGDDYHRILGGALPGIAADSAIAIGESGRLSEAARRRIDLLVAGAYSETCGRGGRRSDDALAWICDQGGAGQGWLGAGSWYMHMARFANEANSLYQLRPEESRPPADYRRSARQAVNLAGVIAGDSWFDRFTNFGGRNRAVEDAARFEGRLEQQWNATVIAAGRLGARIDGRLIEGAFETEGINQYTSGWSEAPRRWLAAKTRQWFLPPPNVDPMAALAEFGNAQLVWGLALAGGGKLLESGLLGLLPVPEIAAELGRIAVVVGVALMTAGAFLAFILPLLPWLLWTAAVTGYFLLIGEAIIAVNLWAIAHLQMDGHTFAGTAARQGYYLVLALTLTPILMVFGFIIGMALFKVTATLIGIGFDAAMRGLAHDQSWFLWLVGMAFVSILMVIVYVVLAERSFSLTAELPGKVLRWVGAGAEVASKEDDRIRASALGAAAAVTAAGREVIQPGRRGPGPARRAARGQQGRSD